MAARTSRTQTTGAVEEFHGQAAGAQGKAQDDHQGAVASPLEGLTIDPFGTGDFSPQLGITRGLHQSWLAPLVVRCDGAASQVRLAVFHGSFTPAWDASLKEGLTWSGVAQ